MRTVIVHGVCTQNVGDDLFFYILKERYPNTRFVMYAPDEYKNTLGRDKKWIIISRSDFPTRLSFFVGKILRLPLLTFLYFWLIIRYRANLFLFIGGSLFMEGKSNMPTFISGLNKLRRIRPKMKISIVGANFGPCITASWKNKVGKSLEIVNDICFRDKKSYDEFSYLPCVRWGNDIVMHMGIESSNKKEKVVCVNIRSVDNWPSLMPLKEEYLNVIKDLIEYYQEKGYSIRLLSFCKKYGDNEIIDELYSRLINKDQVEMYYYDGNLSSFMNVISNAEIMIGTRFHAIILGLLYNEKVLPISYSEKTENMLKSYNLWNEIYDYEQFCSSDVDELTKYFISGFSVEKKMNTMFNYLDTILN